MSVLRYLFYTLLLILVETVICILLFEGKLLFAPFRVDAWHIEKAIRDGLEVNAVRCVFYYLFYVILFYLLVHVRRWRRRLLQVATINCLLYIGISTLYGLILPGALEYFSADFFYFLVLATFISPFLLGKKIEQKLLSRSMPQLSVN